MKQLKKMALKEAEVLEQTMKRKWYLVVMLKIRLAM